jgi:hypothetical protein
MNKVFCEALKLAAYVYVNGTQDSGHGDEYLTEQAKGVLKAATEHGLVRWVNNMPLVNIEKMTGEVPANGDSDEVNELLINGYYSRKKDK